MASGYDDVTLQQLHAMDAFNILMHFVVLTLLFQLLAKHSSAALPCKQASVNTLTIGPIHPRTQLITRRLFKVIFTVHFLDTF